MGKQQKESTAASVRSSGSRAKRKSYQALAPEPAELQRKKPKKAPEPAAASLAPTHKDQKKKADREGPSQGRRKSKKPTKKQQQQAEQEEEEEQQEEEDAGQGEEQQEAAQSVHDLFMEEVHARESELNKHCLIMGQVESEEDETTLEELRGLTKVFVPQQVQEDFMEVWGELDEVGQDSEEEEEGEEAGEDDEDEDGDQPDILGAIMKAILGGKMLNTKHSSQMHAIFKTHQDQVDKAIKSKGWQEAFCRWAALLMASHREKHWYEDTDVPKQAEAIYKRMRQQWLKLKARSDEELGGLVAEGDKSAKDEFDSYLQAVADDMRNMDYKVQDVLA